MHQYTADLANRVAQSETALNALIRFDDNEVHLVTTERYPKDRYLPTVTVHTPVRCGDTGFSKTAFNVGGLRATAQAVRALAPDVVHITGPHIWNTLLMDILRQAGIPVIHTLHDLTPHSGGTYGGLLQAWNRWVIRTTPHLLVHGKRYRRQLLARGTPEWRVTYTPLLHLFLGQRHFHRQANLQKDVAYEPLVLFFGRFERYKGVDQLIAAWHSEPNLGSLARLMLAGKGDLTQLWPHSLPESIEVRNRLIQDDEALELFKRCSLVVLPYRAATQSALVAAAYFFNKPVIVTQSGALAEYVIAGETGWVVPSGDSQALGATLRQALSDPRRLRAMGRAGRRWYEEQRWQEEETLFSMYVGLCTPMQDVMHPAVQAIA
jgi:glycosyltransferase involved in cell wall biosynthesis